MPAEAVAHRGEQLVLVIRFTARRETLVERGGENGNWYALVYSNYDVR
jgi:hypothetical protein